MKSVSYFSLHSLEKTYPNLSTLWGSVSECAEREGGVSRPLLPHLDNGFWDIPSGRVQRSRRRRRVAVKAVRLQCSASSCSNMAESWLPGGRGGGGRGGEGGKALNSQFLDTFAGFKMENSPNPSLSSVTWVRQMNPGSQHAASSLLLFFKYQRDSVVLGGLDAY